MGFRVKGTVRIGVNAPKEVSVHRISGYQRIRAEKIPAASWLRFSRSITLG
ncbi:carbon storage regulator [Salmonella enterica subsp. enterica]|nr:carbon storage regulator [Salmonella enterica subsp. enterica]